MIGFADFFDSWLSVRSLRHWLRATGYGLILPIWLLGMFLIQPHTVVIGSWLAAIALFVMYLNGVI